MYMHTKHKVCTHHEQDAEVGQFSEEILHADRMGVKGKIAAYALVELLHVLVHRGQFFILLPGMLAETVRRTESRKKRKGEKYISHKDRHRQHIFNSYCSQHYNDSAQICSSVKKQAIV